MEPIEPRRFKPIQWNLILNISLLDKCKVINIITSENYTLNSAYNEVTFNEKLPIMKENLCTKYTLLPINTSFLMKSHL